MVKYKTLQVMIKRSIRCSDRALAGETLQSLDESTTGRAGSTGLCGADSPEFRETVPINHIEAEPWRRRLH